MTEEDNETLRGISLVGDLDLAALIRFNDTPGKLPGVKADHRLKMGTSVVIGEIGAPVAAAAAPEEEPASRRAPPCSDDAPTCAMDLRPRCM